MTQPRIFVSHSHKDEDFTQRLVDDLHEAGAEVWVDVAGITHGNFMQRIDEALEHCDWLVLVLTPNALASQYVKDEVYAALHRVKQGYMRDVIPMLAAPCAPGTIPAQWDLLHRYDATQDYAAALAGVLRAVGLPPLAPTPGSAVSPVPAAPAPPLTAVLPPDRFPARLAQLGYEGRVINGVEVIIPPVCEVPAGAFVMGSDPNRDAGAQPSEQPQHTVTLPVYEISRFPVTVAEYACFVRAGQREPQQPTFQNSVVDWPTQLQRLDHPVVCESWNDARSYAGWLSYVTDQPWRLPTEAEWEKAARGTDGRLYPWSDGFEQWRCNTLESGKNTTTPVGTYPAGASPSGAQDMAGNVWEWTSSLYKSYPHKKADGREDQNSTDKRVLRGGSWSYVTGDARAAYRFNCLSDYFNGVIGFRVVRAVPSS